MVGVAPGTAGRDEAMSLAHCMTTLADGSVDPERVDLFPLSGLAHSELEEFRGRLGFDRTPAAQDHPEHHGGQGSRQHSVRL